MSNEERATRIYAANLLGRALGRDVRYDTRDVAVLALVIPLIEADIALGLMGHLPSGSTVAPSVMARLVREGHCRPAIAPPFTTVESNVR